MSLFVLGAFVGAALAVALGILALAWTARRRHEERPPMFFGTDLRPGDEFFVEAHGARWEMRVLDAKSLQKDNSFASDAMFHK